MENDSPSNIFDEASKELGKKGKKKAKKKASAAKKVTKKKKKKVPERIRVPLGDPELEGILDQIYLMDNEIQTKMNLVTELSGMTPQEITTFLENPDNFSPGQWEKMERDKKKLEDKIYSVLGTKAKKRRAKKKKKKLAKGRKGKTLGDRKKWLKM